MKYIDPKSLTIGVLAASLVFACTDSSNKTTNSPSLVSEAKAATSVSEKWDDKQEWVYIMQKATAPLPNKVPVGYQPFAVQEDEYVWSRKRVK